MVVTIRNLCALGIFKDGPRVMDDAQWTDVTMHVALGENEAAIVALEQDVANHYFLAITIMDSDPHLAEFHKDPRYPQILAPARAEVAAARAAGLSQAHSAAQN